MEAPREAGTGLAGPSPEDVRARIYGAVAKAAEPGGRVEERASVTPALTDGLRSRLEEVRARLSVLADAAAGREASGPLHPWPPPDPRDAVPEPPPVPTATVPVDLLARVDADIVETRALLTSTGAALEETGCRRDGEDPEPRPMGAAGSAASSDPSPERDKACMVALNMALNGAPQAETDRYLAENFDLADAHLIVADAYAHCARLRTNGHNGHVT